MKKDDGGPAQYETRRQRLARSAMQGMLAGHDILTQAGTITSTWLSVMVFKYADALIEFERKERDEANSKP